MNHHPGLMTHLQRAEEHVQGARQSWDATDLSRCAAAADYLRQAAEELQAAQRYLGGSAASSAELTAQAKGRLEQLQISVRRLGRLVDAAIAFHRELALDTGTEQTESLEVTG